MPDWLTAVLAIDGLGIIAATVLIAGIVYGFAGFGSALIVLPVMMGTPTISRKPFCFANS